MKGTGVHVVKSKGLIRELVCCFFKRKKKEKERKKSN